MQIPDTVIISAFVSIFGMLVGVVVYVRNKLDGQIVTAHSARLDCQRENEQLRNIIQALVNGNEALARQLLDDYQSSAPTGVLDAIKPSKQERSWRMLGFLPFLPFLWLMLTMATGCADARQDERQQATANSAATIYEAASAIEQGVPAELPVQAIKANASAIATASGHPYPPAAPAATK